MKKRITATTLDQKFDSGTQDVLEHFESAGERMSIDKLRELSGLLNMTELARRAGIRKTTLASKVQRGTPLSEEEALVLHKVLRDAGLLVRV